MFDHSFSQSLSRLKYILLSPDVTGHNIDNSFGVTSHSGSDRLRSSRDCSSDATAMSNYCSHSTISVPPIWPPVHDHRYCKYMCRYLCSMGRFRALWGDELSQRSL
jgi:hypothetical protein